jgi:hypothetical protein
LVERATVDVWFGSGVTGKEDKRPPNHHSHWITAIGKAFALAKVAPLGSYVNP